MSRPCSQFSLEGVSREASTASPGGAGCGTPLQCRVERSFAALEQFRQSWDEAVIRLHGSVYMSYDWVRTWWHFYGSGKELRIFIFTAGEKIVGLLPIYLDTVGLWPL